MAWIFVFILAPISVYIPISIASVSLLFLCIASYVLGFLVLGAFSGRQSTVVQNINFGKLSVLFVLGLSMLGEVCWLVDRLIFRGVSLENSFDVNRVSMENSASSLFSITSAFFLGYCLLIPYVIKNSEYRSSIFFTTAGWVIFWLPSFNSFIFASRSTFLFSVLFLFLLHGLNSFKIKHLLFALGSIAFSMIYFASQRLSSIDRDLTFSVMSAGYSFTLKPHVGVLEKISYFPEILQDVILGFIHMAQYYCHGIFEYFYLYDNYGDRPFTYGGTLFLIPYKFMSFLGIFPDAIIASKNAIVREGVFTSMVGAAFSDFGVFCFLFFLVFGLLSRWVKNKSSQSADYRPLNAFMCSATIFIPCFNVFSAGINFYVLVACLMLPLIARVRKF